MATQTDSCSGRGGKDKSGTSSWAGIVGGTKNDSPGEASKPAAEDRAVSQESGEGAAVARPCEVTAPPGEASAADLDPEELSQFTEIRNKKDRARKKEGARGGRKGGRGGRREYVEWEPRHDRGGEGVLPRARGGKRPGRELAQRQLNGPEGEEEAAVEEGVAVAEVEVEEKVHYVPAPAPRVNIWEKRQNSPANPAPPPARAGDTPAPAPPPPPHPPAAAAAVAAPPAAASKYSCSVFAGAVG